MKDIRNKILEGRPLLHDPKLNGSIKYWKISGGEEGAG
jgi:hypothetical protein